MKQIPQVSSKERPSHRDEHMSHVRPDSPATDFNYQTATEPATAVSVPIGKQFIKLDTFRKVSSEFQASETHRDFIAELVLFISIGGISVYSIFTTMVWIGRLARGY